MKAIYTVLISLLLAISVCGQQGKQLQEKLTRQGITPQNLESIVDAGKSGNKDGVPFLRKLATDPKAKTEFYSAPSFAEIALANLGQENYLTSIINDVESPNIAIQDVAIRKLSKVGDKRVFRIFLKLLDEKEIRVPTIAAEDIARARQIGGRTRGDEAFEPKSFLVMRLLPNMVDDPPFSPNTEPNEAHISVWKIWFQNHEYLLE